MVQAILDAKKTLSDLRKLNSRFPNAAKAVLTEVAAEAVVVGKSRFIPKVTGDLASTARVEKSDDGKNVDFVTGGIQGSKGGFVNYANFVNRGTSRIYPRFFMERSAAFALSQTDSLSRKILDSWLNNAGF